MFGFLIPGVCKSQCRNLLLINIRQYSFLLIIPPTAKENKANKQPSAWIEIPLVEGLESISSSIVCSNLDSGLSIVRFLIYPKDESTKAHLSAHQSIAILPVGFRPPRFDWCFLTTVDFTPAVLPIYIKGNTGIVLTHSDVDFLDIRGTFVFRSV